MTPTFIIARLTFREAVRRRIVLTALILGACFLIIYSIGIHLIVNQISQVAPRGIASMAQKEGISFLLLAGLYTITFLSVAMAALISADTLAGEINSGTIQTVVTKPVRRADVVLGKWLGFAGLLAIYILLMAGGVVISVKLQANYLAPNLLRGIGLIYLESLVMMSVALLLSSRFSALATGGAVFGLYGLAFIGGWVEQFGSMMQSQTTIYIGIISSLIFPCEAIWRRAAYEMQSPLSGVLGMSPFSAISVPSALMIVYAIIFALVALALTFSIFAHRDL
jgi:ABC-type transport system involved in multi-copper enzyme maturation permease subunit